MRLLLFKNLVILLYTNFLKTFSIFGERDIEQQLLQSNLEPFLCTGMILAVLKTDGNIPIEKEILQMSER